MSRLGIMPLFFAAVLACALVPAAAGQDAAAPALSPADVLARAGEALGKAGNIKATINLDVSYPSHYKSAITLYAAPSGDERAEISTTVNSNSYSSLEVISGGVLWTLQETVGGAVVTKIDLKAVRESLAGKNAAFAALPIFGTNALFDLAGLAAIVDFDQVAESSIDGQKVYVLSGGLSPKFTSGGKTKEGGMSLPAGAQRWYQSASVYVGEDFLPRRIELGVENGKPLGDNPLLRLDFTGIETNVTLPQGVFDIQAPKDAELIDRTQWALAQLTGG